MGFNYSWFKKGATTLSNQRVFNRYFKKGKKNEYSKKDNFKGLEFTKKLGDYVRDNLGMGKYFSQRERYYPVFSMTNNTLQILVLFLPPILGGVASLACGFAIIFALTSINKRGQSRFKHPMLR